MIKLIMRLKKHLSKNSNRDERQQIASKLFSSVTSSLYRSSIRAIWVLVGQLLKLHQLSVILLIRPLQVLHVLHHHLGGLAHAFLLLHNTEHKVALAVHQRSMKEPGLLWLSAPVELLRPVLLCWTVVGPVCAAPRPSLRGAGRTHAAPGSATVVRSPAGNNQRSLQQAHQCSHVTWMCRRSFKVGDI